LFHEAQSFGKAYVTDMIQELIDSNIKIKPILISGKWCEIDTMQDLKNAEKIFFPNHVY
jgi:NDP-sugar pyrophosphorylase family protein